MSTLTAQNYGWQSAEVELSHNYLINPAINAIKKYKVKSLLDIGTGNGSTIPVWLSQGIRVAAMEPDLEGFEFSRQHTDADVRRCGAGDALPADWKENFDAIVCLEVIEHLFNPDDLIQSIDYTLKQKGIAIISTPYHGYAKNLLLALMNKWDFHHHPLRTGGHIKFWSKKTLMTLFQKAGFKVLSFEGAGRWPFLWKSMVITFQKD